MTLVQCGIAGIALIGVASCAHSAGTSSSDARGQPAPSAAHVGSARPATPRPLAALRNEKQLAPRSLSSPALVLTAAMTVTVKRSQDMLPSARRAEGLARSVGGRVDSEVRVAGDTSGRGGHPQVSLTLRIPNPRLATVLDRLARLGTESSRQLSTTDITAELVDVTARVSSARAAIAQLNRLYKLAANVRDIITIETALAQRQADLNSLQAQQNELSAQTALATVTLTLTSDRGTPAASRHHLGGFAGGWRSGWHAFATAALAVATALGAALPFAAVLLVGAGTVVALRRRRGRARPPTGNPEPGSA